MRVLGSDAMMMHPDEAMAFNPPQVPLPDDFASRLALAGVQFGHPGRITSQTPGGGLAALLGLASAFGNYKVGGARRKIADVDQRNLDLRKAAQDLANRRNQVRLQTKQIESTRENLNSREETRRYLQDRRLEALESGQPLVRVQTPTGVMWVPRGQAAGMEAPASVPRPVQVIDPSTGDIVYVDPAGAIGRTAPRGRRTPTSAQSNDLTDDLAVIAQTDEVKKLFSPAFVGPVSGGLRGYVGSRFRSKLLKPGEAKFRASVATYANKARNKLYGSALSAGERAEAIKQIPDVNDPPETFLSKLEITRGNVRRVAAMRRDVYTGSGLDLSGIPPLPVSDEEAAAIYKNTVGNKNAGKP